jgi:hypothetical protein
VHHDISLMDGAWLPHKRPWSEKVRHLNEAWRGPVWRHAVGGSVGGGGGAMGDWPDEGFTAVWVDDVPAIEKTRESKCIAREWAKRRQ